MLNLTITKDPTEARNALNNINSYQSQQIINYSNKSASHEKHMGSLKNNSPKSHQTKSYIEQNNTCMKIHETKGH